MEGKVGTKAELNFEPRINGWNQESDRIQIVYRIYVFPRAGLDFELFSQVFYFCRADNVRRKMIGRNTIRWDSQVVSNMSSSSHRVVTKL